MVLQGFPQSVIRVVSYLGLNYVHPHNKQIVQQGRHLLMIKVYESKQVCGPSRTHTRTSICGGVWSSALANLLVQEAHCWFIPLDEVLRSHAQTSEALKSGISLNDVQARPACTAWGVHSMVLGSTA